MSWQNDVLAPPCLASIVISSGRRSKQNPEENNPVCYRTTWPGRDRRQRTANSNRQRDSRLGARQASSPLSPLLLPMNKREAQPSRPPLRTPHHPPTQSIPRAGTCSWDIRDDRSHHQLAGSGNRCGVSRGESDKERGRRKGWTRHHASMMLAPCPKRSRPGTLQS